MYNCVFLGRGSFNFHWGPKGTMNLIKYCITDDVREQIRFEIQIQANQI